LAEAGGRRGALTWLALCALAAAGAAAGWLLPAGWLDWQPTRAASEPWRLWSAAFVHWSPLHLGANLAGCAVLAGFGAAAAVPGRAAMAWLLAWPLTHAALLAQPALAHYGGLSGVLHAGVAVVAVALLARAGRSRAVGAAVAAGLLAKLLLERPWAGPLAHPAGWDIAVAPLAHVSGALCGLACAALCRVGRRPAATMPPR
jgi:rhomboid family GlyGly-CTERM serine protease